MSHECPVNQDYYQSTKAEGLQHHAAGRVLPYLASPLEAIAHAMYQIYS